MTTTPSVSGSYFAARTAHRDSLKQLWAATNAHVDALVAATPREHRLEQLSLALTSEIIGERHLDEVQRMLIDLLADALSTEAQRVKFERHAKAGGAA
jgi:hypothetical protein